jgi:hemerythrin-like domain-containing protein
MAQDSGLEALSEDNRRTLAQARRLRRVSSGADGTIWETAHSLLDFFRAELDPHFRKVEELLLPLMVRESRSIAEECFGHVLLGYARLRGLALGLEQEIGRGRVRTDTLTRVAELLETHVHLEQRMVLPLVERRLPPRVLAEFSELSGSVKPELPEGGGGLRFDPWPGPGDSEGGGTDWTLR